MAEESNLRWFFPAFGKPFPEKNQIARVFFPVRHDFHAPDPLPSADG
jgi:hypothetical protein